MNQQLKNRFGFTMIEVLVVIIILGIISGIGVARWGDFRFRAQKAALLADIKQMETIVQTYILMRGSEPNRFPNNPGGMTDQQWNDYARDHLNDYFVGGWPVQTPFGGFYTYRAYPENWTSSSYWGLVEGNKDITDFVGDDPFEIVMIRFLNPRDVEGFEKTLAALKDSHYLSRLFRFRTEENLGILIR